MRYITGQLYGPLSFIAGLVSTLRSSLRSYGTRREPCEQDRHAIEVLQQAIRQDRARIAALEDELRSVRSSPTHLLMAHNAFIADAMDIVYPDPNNRPHTCAVIENAQVGFDEWDADYAP